MKRVANEPAFVLHRYDWSESSLILEVFTRQHGRVALAAKGVKKPSSNFRPVLLPLQPLQIAFAGDGEIRTLKAAQWMGPHTMPMGEALMAGYHVNELLLKLLPRDDPHPRLFDAYAPAVQQIAQGASGAEGAAEAVQPVLRAFELLLLRELGLLPQLHVQTATLAPLDETQSYTLHAEGGLRTANANGGGEGAFSGALTGAQWQHLHAALDGGSGAAQLSALADACEPVATALKPMLRGLLQYHGGVQSFKTRQIMVDLQAMLAPA